MIIFLASNWAEWENIDQKCHRKRNLHSDSIHSVEYNTSDKCGKSQNDIFITNFQKKTYKNIFNEI